MILKKQAMVLPKWFLMQAGVAHHKYEKDFSASEFMANWMAFSMKFLTIINKYFQSRIKPKDNMSKLMESLVFVR